MFSLFKKPCTSCKTLTEDFIAYGLKLLGPDTKPFCREHLLEEFKNKLLETPYPIIVFHPQLENEKNKSVQYFYRSMKRVEKERFGSQEDKNLILYFQDVLCSITGKKL